MSRPLRISFVANLDPFAYEGGGEMVLQEVIRTGRRRGHLISISSAHPRLRPDIRPDADLFVIADLYNNPRSWLGFPKQIVQEIVRNRPFVHIDNAYVDVCDEPYLPCSGKVAGDNCPFKSSLWHQLRGSTRCFRARTSDMYRRSLLNVFVSPLHRKTIQNLLGEDTLGDYYELKPTVDPSLFRDRGGERDVENLFVGVLCEAKGYHNMEQSFPDGNIVLIGKRHRSLKKRPFGREIGPVPYREIPGYMKRARNFVFLPRWPEPMGRALVEAALAGCNLITNDNVGALSYGFDIANPDNFAGTFKEFWEEIERIADRHRHN